MDGNYTDDLIDDDEVPELTAEDFAQMVPFAELPLDLQELLLQVKTATFVPDPWPKERVEIELSRPVLERFRAAGAGWQGKVDEALLQWMEEHKAS